jgi:hypothetical protein
LLAVQVKAVQVGDLQLAARRWLPMKSAPMVKACASPSGLGCAKRGVSCGVLNGQ